MGYKLSNKISQSAKNNQVIPSVFSGIDITLASSVGNRLSNLNSADKAKLILNLRTILANPNANTWDTLTRGISTLPTINENSQTRLTNADVVNAIEDFRRTTRSVNKQINSTQLQPFIFSLKNLNATYPGPAKFYENNITSQRWVFPVPPDSFSVSSPSSPNIITTISGNTYSHAGNIELDEISFSGFFPFFVAPQVNSGGFNNNILSVLDSSSWPLYIPDYLKANTAEFAKYYSPGEWVSNIVTAQRSNQPLEFCVYAPNAQNEPLSTSSETDLVIYPIPVTITAFSWKVGGVGGDRRDVEFNITLKRWKEQRLRLDTFSASVRRPAAQPQYHTTRVVGNVQDNILIISQKYFPNKKKWNQIYEYNKVSVDKWFAAYNKRNPSTGKTLFNFLLPVGQKIKLPKVS